MYRYSRWQEEVSDGTVGGKRRSVMACIGTVGGKRRSVMANIGTVGGTIPCCLDG